MRKQICRFLLLTVIIVFVTGCSTAPPAPPVAGRQTEITTDAGPDKVMPLNPEKIALLLPLTGSLAPAGNAVLQGFLVASYERWASAGKSAPVLRILDSNNLDMPKALKHAVDDGVDLIIGPLSRQNVNRAIGLYHKKVPWLMLNYASEDKKPGALLYQFGLSAEDEAACAATKAWKAEYRHPLIITNDTFLGKRVADYFAQKWQSFGGSIAGKILIGNQQNNNKAVAEALLVNESRQRASALRALLSRRMDFTVRRRKDIDIVFMKVTPEQGRQIKPALNFYFADKLPVLSVSDIYNGEIRAYQNKDLDNVYFTAALWQLKALPLLSDLQNVSIDTHKSNARDLYSLGIDANHIYPYLNQMLQNSKLFFNGYTGRLSIDKNGRIKRKLLWATFNKGKTVLKNLPANTAVSPSLVAVSPLEY